MPEKIGQILIHKGVAPATTVESAVIDAQHENQRIGDFLIARHNIPEALVYQALAEQFGLPFIGTIDERINEKILREFPVELFKDGRCFVLSSDETTVNVVVADPLDLDILLEVHALTNLAPGTMMTTPSQMSAARDRLFKDNSLLMESAGRISREYEKHLQFDESAMTLEEIRKRTESEPVVKMAQLIFDEAIALRASDIHIEPMERSASIRFRIDGMLRPHMDLSRHMFVPLTSRIKILADLDIAEKRMSQDGRIRHVSAGQQYDFRISTLPTHYGEKTVIRILKHDKNLLEPSLLGMPDKELRILLDLIEKPQGMLFVTGPTGSGKSSTLFACLNKIKHKPINITTIENPIEYKIDGLNQVQINEKAGVTFASALRSILRQDPDVILVGEIRDGETAQIAIQAAQTGHLVLSTLHTNDAVSAITRLRDLGVPSYLIASSMVGIVAQRLVRVLCDHCKTKVPPSEDLRRRWKAMLGDYPLPDSFESRGCEICHDTGFCGRSGVFELVPINESLRTMIGEDLSDIKIRQHIRALGFNTLIQNGIYMIETGRTTPDELLRVVLVEDILQQKD